MSQTHAPTTTVLLAVGLMLLAGTAPVAVAQAPTTDGGPAADRFDLADEWWNRGARQVQNTPVETTRTVSVTDPAETGSYGVTVTEITVPETVAENEPVPVEVDVANVNGEEEIGVVSIRIAPAGSDGVRYAESQSFSLAENGGTATASYRIDAGTLPPGDYTITIHTVKNGEVGTIPFQVTDAA